MTYEQLAKMAEEAGFSAWAPLDMATIELKPEVRDMCATNSCGQYAKRWSCPPGCGTLEECTQRLTACTHGILVQTYGDIEDGFDFEAMMEIESDHKDHFSEMYEALREAGDVPTRLEDKDPVAVLTAYDDSAIRYTLFVWVACADYWSTLCDVNARIRDVFQAKGIEMTYPHLNIHLEK